MVSRPLLALGILAAIPLSAQPLEVTAVRFWSFSGVTRVAIETSGEFQFRSDHIYNPERIFFDLIGVRPHINGRRIATQEVGDKLLKRIRVAETTPGTARIVLDIESPVEFTASPLGNPDRLIIELKPAELRPASPQPQITSSPQPILETPPALRVPANLAAKPVIIPDPGPALPAAVGPGKASAARRTTSDGNRSLTRALGLKIHRVVIDAGHGGHDQGTVGSAGLMEKELVLDVALRLGKLIEQRMGSEVIYTRTDDTFIPLEERTAIANQKRADLFLSIHANSSPASNAAGVETFYLNFTSSPDSLDVAARENASSQKSVYELRDLIQSITLHDKIEESREFAGDIQNSLQAFASRYSANAKNRGVKKAPFVVLIGASMPSVLAEVGFLSNPREEKLLMRPDHRQKLSEALYRGLFRYAQTLSHFEVAHKTAQPVEPTDEPAAK